MNERIRAPKVRVIDGTTNKQLGILSTHEALQIAKSKGLDLVEVTENSDPPVCKIVEYGKYKYEQSKQQKERNKSKAAARIKEVKFRVRIDTHDYNIKMQHAEEFLSAGHKLRIQLQFRGREMAHQELGMQLMHKVKDDLDGMGHIDMEPRKAGRNITMMLSPLPSQQQKRKFSHEDDDFVEDESLNAEEDKIADEEEDKIADEGGDSADAKEAKDTKEAAAKEESPKKTAKKTVKKKATKKVAKKVAKEAADKE